MSDYKDIVLQFSASFCGSCQQAKRYIKGLNAEDKIVYVGKYLYANLLVALNQRGVLAIITHSMDYNDYIKHEGNIVVLSGFGHVPLNKENFVIDRKIDECTVNISSKVSSNIILK